jgi:hypothetical protein
LPRESPSSPRASARLSSVGSPGALPGACIVASRGPWPISRGMACEFGWRRQVRRFFCDHAGCRRRIFTERFPETAARPTPAGVFALDCPRLKSQATLPNFLVQLGLGASRSSSKESHPGMANVPPSALPSSFDVATHLAYLRGISDFSNVPVANLASLMHDRAPRIRSRRLAGPHVLPGIRIAPSRHFHPPSLCTPHRIMGSATFESTSRS